jgi:hypothetical protein
MFEAIGRHVLALEVDRIAFREAILPLVKEVELQHSEKSVYSLDLDSPCKKRAKRVLDCE